MKHRFGKNIKWFLLIFLVSALVWQGIFWAVDRPSEGERLQIFVTADGCDREKLLEKLEALPVRQLQVVDCGTGQSRYYDLFSTAGLLGSDLLVMESTVFDVQQAHREFVPLSRELLEQYGLDPQEFTFVEKDGQACAIVVYDRSLGIDLLQDCVQVCDPEKQYCIAVNILSLHCAPYSWEENATDYAFRALALLLQ